MQFAFPILTFGFLLVLVPILIHLINMMRHRRIDWAPMVFLLKAYKKQRRWIWLKQLLLLLMRMGAIAAIVAMLAHLQAPDQWSKFLSGGHVTHHYILVDDSYSMSESDDGTSAFDRAKEFVDVLGGKLVTQDSRHKVTLIRYSWAAATVADGKAETDDKTADEKETTEGTPATSDTAAKSDTATDSPTTNELTRSPDLIGEMVGENFKNTLDDLLNNPSFAVSELSVGPGPALETLQRMLGSDKQETPMVYVVSDFREQQWGNPADLKSKLKGIRDKGAEIHLIGCTDVRRPNLGVTRITPADTTHAAGVPFFVNISVKNHGSVPEKNIKVKLKTHRYGMADIASEEPAKLKIEDDILPDELIEEIPAGETVTRRVEVFFPDSGQHVIEATLPGDPVVADNMRLCVINVLPSEKVLLIEDSDLGFGETSISDNRPDSYYIKSAFEPGVRANTGVVADVKPSAWLREASPVDIARYKAIYLVDVPKLEGTAIEKLEQYVGKGGGLAFFLGPNVDANFYNSKFFRDGTGLMPLALDRIDKLEEQRSDPGEVATTPQERAAKLADFHIEDHPVFSIFTGVNRSLLSHIIIDSYWRTVADTKRDSEDNASDVPLVGAGGYDLGKTNIIARLRSPCNQPFVVERDFGKGRVVVCTTTAGPRWNTWARTGPTFLPTMLCLQDYLAAPQRATVPRMVGSSIGASLRVADYTPGVRFITPGVTPLSRTLIEQPTPVEDGSVVMDVQLGLSDDRTTRSGKTDRTGIYEIWAKTSAGPVDVRRFALNVQPEEGDTTAPDEIDLAETLKPLEYEYHDLKETNVQYEMVQDTGTDWSRYVLYLLVLLLLGEQLLAYLLSYHPAKGGAK